MAGHSQVVAPSSPRPGASYWIGPWHIEPLRLRINAPSGESKTIEPKMMLVLLLLIEHQGSVVTRDELLSAVWPDVVVSDDSLSRCISQLRKIFHDGPTAAEVIQTVRSRGYRLAQDSRVDGAAESTSLRTPAHQPGMTRFASMSRRASLGLATLIFAFGVGWMTRSLTASPLVVYRNADPMGEIGVIPDSVLLGKVLPSEMAFFVEGELASETP